MKLNDRQSANPGQCGSCQNFRPREPGDGHGECQFRFPPWLMSYFKTAVDPKAGYEVDPRTVQDTATCSIYTPKMICGRPAEFVQERIWQAGNPAR